MISAPPNDLWGKTTILSYYFALFFNWVKIWEVSEVVIFGGVHPSWTSRQTSVNDWMRLLRVQTFFLNVCTFVFLSFSGPFLQVAAPSLVSCIYVFSLFFKPITASGSFIFCSSLVHPCASSVCGFVSCISLFLFFVVEFFRPFPASSSFIFCSSLVHACASSVCGFVSCIYLFSVFSVFFRHFSESDCFIFFPSPLVYACASSVCGFVSCIFCYFVLFFRPFFASGSFISVGARVRLLRVWRSKSKPPPLQSWCRDGWREGWADGKFDRIEVVPPAVDTGGHMNIHLTPT